MKFDWEGFKCKNNKIAIHCKNEKEANHFCREADKHSLKWFTGNRLTDNSFFDFDGKDTCYDCYGTLISHDSYEYFKSEGFTILEWNSYMYHHRAKTYKDEIKPEMI